MHDQPLWWQLATVYEVYVRSFHDANADGVGDLRGVRDKLEYLEWLGVDAIWLTPIYPSPMADFGYDVANYVDVDPLFGTLGELDALIAAAHARGLKIILDFVPNHTSDRHPWFLSARADRKSPFREYYIWHDGVDGRPPNNWLSCFGGSAWTWDEQTRQFYYHAFLKEQPDLNWRNPEVRRSMYQFMRFWLERGIDGFRVDVLWHLIKDLQLRDNPLNPEYAPGDIPYKSLIPAYSTDQPEVQEIVREMRAVLEEYGARVLIGEIYLPLNRLVAYYGADLDGAHLPFNFQLITLPWDARRIAAAISEYEGALPERAWPNWVLGNHDQPRVASRVGPAQARVAALLLLTLRGTPTLYYGDELGMRDVPIAPEDVRDPQGKIVGVSRDPERTPMQWSAAPAAGFSRVEPWLPVAPDYAELNVERQKQDPDSLLCLYRRLIALRRASPALGRGSYTPLATQGELLAYRREHQAERLLVVLNLADQPAELELEPRDRGQVVLATNRARESERIGGHLRLAANEGLIVRLS